MTIRYVCWQPLLTDHQAYTYEALRNEVDGRLTINIGRAHDPVRAAQGWVGTGGSDIEKRLIPKQGWRQWARREIDRDPDAVHLFGSPFEQPRQIAIMSMACRAGRRVALISEPFSTSGAGYLADGGKARGWLKAKLRPLLYRAYGLHFARRLHAVFGISPLSCDQYAALGVPLERIFPFGYFVPGGTGTSTGPDDIVRRSNAAPLRLVFVGALIARKGLTTAIDAVRQLRAEGRDVTLDIYGAGDPTGYLLDNAVTYRGTMPFGRAGETMVRYDALVLPSLFDGWAVVVNEALQAGTPVCCSDAVGAGAVVQAHGAGATFPANDAAALADVLRGWIMTPATLAAARAATEQVAPLLEPVVAARYLHDAILSLEGKGARPADRWYPWGREKQP